MEAFPIDVPVFLVPVASADDQAVAAHWRQALGIRAEEKAEVVQVLVRQPEATQMEAGQ